MLTNSDNYINNAITKLKKLAVAKSITQQEIANHVELNRSTVSMHLNKSDMSMREFFSIARYVGVDPIEILRESRLEVERTDSND
ncbi:XRE family transcriptional regulator [Alloscardovia theropitheci]|uniref:XRE family transcriptional regulator n=1 Tax=Alloscardovia theropitheci TaxID=2496842 RepID=A0A4R0QQX9_9BIFI|nr:helix-turn-helix transcriptional regulator [Alloscardovia theropitheci]TCD53748.1 XRE family transcriptional regulator [Alloscardovia theropitheci]